MEDIKNEKYLSIQIEKLHNFLIKNETRDITKFFDSDTGFYGCLEYLGCFICYVNNIHKEIWDKFECLYNNYSQEGSDYFGMIQEKYFDPYLDKYINVDMAVRLMQLNENIPILYTPVYYYNSFFETNYAEIVGKDIKMNPRQLVKLVRSCDCTFIERIDKCHITNKKEFVQEIFDKYKEELFRYFVSFYDNMYSEDTKEKMDFFDKHVKPFEIRYDIKYFDPKFMKMSKLMKKAKIICNTQEIFKLISIYPENIIEYIDCVIYEPGSEDKKEKSLFQELISEIGEGLYLNEEDSTKFYDFKNYVLCG